jgi:molybdate transport system regulatory protein
MKSSARNVLKGTVLNVKEGSVNSEVTMELSGGEPLVAVVTNDSVKSLHLTSGSEAMALIKAPWVMLMTECDDVRLSARNCLKGSVISVSDGAVNAEVILELPGGSRVCSIVTREAVLELGLEPGTSATAIIKASHIILAVPA